MGALLEDAEGAGALGPELTAAFADAGALWLIIIVSVGEPGASVSADDAAALFGDLGVRVWRPTPPAGGFAPELGVAWVHDFDIDDADVDASFAGIPDLGFTMPGQDAEADGVRLSLGLGYRNDRGLSTFLRYMGEVRGDMEWHAIEGRLRWEF
jgi:uncharacterized protein with beta-barrel porin domain